MIPHIKPYLSGHESIETSLYLYSGGYLTEHNYTEKFEKQLAKFLGVKYVSCVPSGTVALYLSLLASLSKGSRVLVPDITMIATYNAVVAAGMEPVLVDVDYEYGLMDLEGLPKADAMIYVDLNGEGFPDEFVPYCKDRNMVLIEDACQALGSEFRGRKFGTFGRFGCFSLGFHKIITTGQGGFIVTHNKKDYETIERLKDFGRLKGGNDIHNTFGLNFKFTDVQAVIGLEQLRTIKWRIRQKREIFKWYWGQEPKKGYVPWFIDNTTDVLNLEYNLLTGSGIGCRKMYPPLHTQKFINVKGDFEGADYQASHVLWYPSSLSLTKKEVDLVKRSSCAEF